MSSKLLYNTGFIICPYYTSHGQSCSFLKSNIRYCHRSYKFGNINWLEYILFGRCGYHIENFQPKNI